ncbi:kinase A anchor protein [Microdochium trichocladiopsis]|uniref:Kinase A anchor protein n=1 Tax=Microdochium trichocladiopsis TaxID=1682393 RepID=A0A9P9BVT8_9PEZI|nr:kinase A anchor protein [Microdochium trichocladiopsis]KAH7040092.1 kinase A anchor protein [Microdochium trichocladiopsis]
MPPRAAPTHFLCLPLVTSISRPQLARSLGAFGADVTSPESFAIPEQAVRPLGTLHLTLGVMSLQGDARLEGAIALLRSLVPSPAVSAILQGNTQQQQLGRPDALQELPQQHQQEQHKPARSLSITLRGLHSIQPPAKATVLYAPPIDDGGTLLQLCQHLRSAFQEAGFMDKEDRPLLLHATVVNTIYVKGAARSGPGPSRGKRNDKLTIDAREILNRYDDYLWMQDVPVEKVAICRMGAKEQPDGEVAYEAEAEVELR